MRKEIDHQNLRNFEFKKAHPLVQEPKALLVQHVDELDLEVLVRVPRTAGHRGVRLDVEQHVQLLLAGVHRTHRLDQLLALHLLEDLVQVDGRYVRLEANLLRPDALVAGVLDDRQNDLLLIVLRLRALVQLVQ